MNLLLFAILVLLALAGLVVARKNTPPLHAVTVIRIWAGAIQVARGKVQPLAREHVAEILREAAVTKGWIALTSGRRVVFSRTIPEAVHQRLRNVLLNQTA